MHHRSRDFPHWFCLSSSTSNLSTILFLAQRCLKRESIPDPWLCPVLNINLFVSRDIYKLALESVTTGSSFSLPVINSWAGSSPPLVHYIFTLIRGTGCSLWVQGSFWVLSLYAMAIWKGCSAGWKKPQSPQLNPLHLGAFRLVIVMLKINGKFRI